MGQCPRCAASVQPHEATCLACGTALAPVRHRSEPVLAGVLAGGQTPAASRATRRDALPERRVEADAAVSEPVVDLRERPRWFDQPVIVPAAADAAPQGRRRLLLIGGALVGVIAVAAVAVLALRPGSPTTVAAAPTALAPAPAAEWKLWYSSACSCAVEVPAATTDRSADLPGTAEALPGAMVRSRYDRREVSFGFQQLRPGWTTEPGAVLDAAMANVATMKVDATEPATVAGLPARRFTGTDAATNLPGAGVVVANGSNLYLFLAVGDADVRADLDRVVGSLRLG